jgi:general secretion pathway protein L
MPATPAWCGVTKLREYPLWQPTPGPTIKQAMSTQVLHTATKTAISANVTPMLLPLQAVGARDKEVWAVVPALACLGTLSLCRSGLHQQKKRLLPALQALLEEHLLDDPESVHWALQPNWQASKQVGVAVCQKEWLRTHLNQLQNLGHSVHRIVP